MGQLEEMNAYVRRFRLLATQLGTYAAGGVWFRAGVPVEQAAAWASLGYLYGEAAPLIAAGITPELAAEAEAAERGDMSREEHAMLVMEQLAGRGLIILPPADE